MQLKRLDELSIDELKYEYTKAGLEGDAEEVLCIIRLTIYLLKVGEDPFSFLFDIEEEIKKTIPRDLEVDDSAVSSYGPVDGLSAETFSVSLPKILPVLVESSSVSMDVRKAVSFDGMSTLTGTLDSSLMSLISPFSSSRSLIETTIFLSLDICKSQTVVWMKRKLYERESGETLSFKFSQNFEPVLWPPDVCTKGLRHYFLLVLLVVRGSQLKHF